jgi:hypothetical protein
MEQRVSLELASVRLQASDASALLRLSEGIGWKLTLVDWQVALTSGAVFGHRTSSGHIVSTATIFPYGQQLASIAFVITHPEHRRKGLARAVVQQCL